MCSTAPAGPWNWSRVLSYFARSSLFCWRTMATGKLPNQNWRLPNAHGRTARLAFDFRFADPRTQLHRIDRGEALQPYASNNVQNGLEPSFLLARANPTPANIEAAANLMLTYRQAPYVALPNLVGLGRLDLVFRYAADPAIMAQFRAGGRTYVLFRVNMGPFDRRFPPFADRIGLVSYWQASGIGPISAVIGISSTIARRKLSACTPARRPDLHKASDARDFGSAVVLHRAGPLLVSESCRILDISHSPACCLSAGNGPHYSEFGSDRESQLGRQLPEL
jgi:hypothetical protein